MALEAELFNMPSFTNHVFVISSFGKVLFAVSVYIFCIFISNPKGKKAELGNSTVGDTDFRLKHP